MRLILNKLPAILLLKEGIDMIAEQRYQLILSIVNQSNSATVQQLADALDTSESTIRRDLISLDQQGKLRRVHGGAAAIDGQFFAEEDDMLTKQSRNVQAKQSIGTYAAGLILPEDFVYIDAGSTTLELVRAIQGDALRATYVTNGLSHSRILARKGCTVYVLSGKVKNTTEAIVGTQALERLKQYSFTKAFLGANGVTLDKGYSTSGVEEVEVKAEAVRSSREHWFLADESKFGKLHAAVICELESCPLITNRLPNPAFREHTTVKETELL